ncbi:MAG: glycosyltransferase family 1 protein [Bacteroidota bacterium]
MRIGIYLKLITPQAGGGFTYQDELMRALTVLKNHHHHFVLLCQGDGVVPIEESPNVRIVKLGSNLFRRILTVFGVTHLGQDLQTVFNKKFSLVSPRILKNEHIDIVWYPAGALFGSLTVPYIATVWDSQHRLQPWFPELSTGGEWFFRERHYEVWLKQAAYVIAGNNAGKEEAERFYGIPSANIRLLAHPTPQFALEVKEQVKSDIKERFSISDPFIFYPAQFWPHKNQQLLIKAVHHLKEKYKISISVALPGSDKGNKGHIREMAERYGVSDQVHFLNFVSREELIFLYQNAFALVIPSFFGPENFPPLEAFALGCPVVAANVAGAKEQYGDAALFFDPKNHQELADHLKRMLTDTRIHKDLIKRGKKRSKEWTNKDYVEKMISLFNEFESIRDCWPRA